jgi:type II secretory pathway component HofQ
MPTLPLTQIDDRWPAADLDNRTFALTFAQPVAIRDLLLLLVRGTSLSMIPDPGISGAFIGELKNVTVRQALDLILQPLGLDYKVDGGFIRVFKREPEMRLFDVNYIGTERTSTVATSAGAPGGSTAQVSSRTAGDVFSDLAKGVQPLLSERASFSVDRKAGLLQVIDFPERLDRVAVYLDAVHDRVHRQVQIDVRVVEVQLKSAATLTIDWNAVLPASPPTAAGGPPALTSVRVTDVARLLTALEGQGKVTTIGGTRLRALNNETAIVRAASDIQVRTKQDRAADPVLTDGLTVTVTPQIGSDGSVMLSLSPMLTLGPSDAGGKLAGRSSGEADMLARLADGETMVVGGFSHSGYSGRSPGVTSRRTEVLVLLTPKILHATPD